MSRAVITQRTDTLTHPRLGWHLLWMLHMAFFLCLLSANACASKEKIEGSRMETDGEWRYGYDKDGNLVERYKGSGKWWDAKREHWKYAWNDFVKSDEQSGTCSGFAMARNRILKNQNGSLAGVQRPDRHGHWVEFTYDALGRRLSKSASEQTNWLWNGNVPLHEWTSGQRYEDEGWKPYEEDFKTWIFEESSFVPLALLQDGHTYSIMTDHLGTPTEMYDENGEEVWYRRLDMNGKIIKEECHRRTSYYKNVTVPFLFQGQYYDYETELAYNRFRYYSPNMGCYISQDPIGLAGNNPTLYGYVMDTNLWWDVWGLKAYRKSEAGSYSVVGGHHIHAKAGFKQHNKYSQYKAFCIGQDYMKIHNIDHDAITKKQRELLKELALSGRPNTLSEHNRIAVESLVAGGLSQKEARSLVAKSLLNLRKQGVLNPTNIPWYK